MTWKYIGDGRFISGVPARDLTDEEFAAADAAHAGALGTCQHPDVAATATEAAVVGDAGACLLYEHVEDRSERAERAPPRRGGPAASAHPGGDE